MYIYIDESGNFTTRADGSSVGAVGALVVTESQLPILERRYHQLRPLLPKDRGEVKGKLLAEAEVSRVIDVARRCGLLFEATVIDLLPNHTANVTAHRAGQCEGLTRSLTPEHQPSTVDMVWNLRRRLEQVPLQLYVQTHATLDVIWTTFQHATLYYCQREPLALSRFQWVVDAKAATGITDWEDWWSTMLLPMTQARSIREPFGQLEDGDYSHFAATDAPIPEYLLRAAPEISEKSGLLMNAAFREVKFSPLPTPCLEIVDVLTNALRRALTGHLGEAGWRGLPGLMIHRRKPTYVRLLSFDPNERKPPTEVAAVLRKLGKGGRLMLTDG